MTISFNSIPATIRTPGQFIEFDSSRAVTGLSDIPKKVYFIGPKTAGTKANDVAVFVPSAALAETYYGHGSILAGMIAAYKAVDPYTECYACSLQEAAGVADIRTLTWTHDSTAGGTISVYIGGHKIDAVLTGVTTIANIAIAVKNAIIADCALYNTPVVATSTATETVITALCKGTHGAELDVRLNYNASDVLPAGVTYTITATTPGTGVPVITPAITAMGSQWFSTIVTHINETAALYANYTLLQAELVNRWGPNVMQDCQVFTGFPGTQGQMTALGNTRNSQFFSVIGTGLSPTPTWIWASVVAALDTMEADPARPRQTLTCTGCLPPAPGSELTWTERNTLLSDGVSTYVVGSDGVCRLERLITTYQTNGSGATDLSYLDITTMRTLAYIRYSLRQRIALRFPRHKLANDGTLFGAGQAIVTPAIIKSEVIALFKEWETAGLVEGVDQFIADILVERHSGDVNRVDVRMSPDLMNQFMAFAGQVQFIL